MMATGHKMHWEIHLENSTRRFHSINVFITTALFSPSFFQRILEQMALAYETIVRILVECTTRRIA